jgi:glucosamine-6-phosphate deaminase
VWFRFSLAEATVMVPVDEEGLAEMDDAFMTCFSTQREASFPSPDYDGPFSEWSSRSQRDQYTALKVLLGQDFFTNNKLESARGFVYLKEMDSEAFIQSAGALKSTIQA